MLLTFFLLLMISPIDGIYQSMIKLSPMGFEYQPKNPIQLISTKTIETKIDCYIGCNQFTSCRIFDYDLISKQCRLFEGDSTTGSIISSSSSRSYVGTIYISSNLYLSNHNQLCQFCEQNRYEVCSINRSRCQCPDHTYWNGEVCALQLFENDKCDQEDSCRSDFNLTCLSKNCYGDFSKCSSSILNNTIFSSTMYNGITVAGGCNGSSSTNQTLLNDPAGILLGYNNTLYVADYSNRLLVFELNNRIGQTARSFNSWPTFLFLDKRSSEIYITCMLINLVYIWPINTTIPPSGISYNNCSMNSVPEPTGIIVDSIGNVYISSYSCHWVTKWTPNATSGIVIAGSLTGAWGTDSQSLMRPYNLALDEANSFLYVVDRFNNRVQRFFMDGSRIGVTVAGGNGQGSSANQLYNPTDIYLSKLDGSIYIADCYNNRIEKWEKNATIGITIAGSSTGISGIMPYMLNEPYAIAIDDQEKYLYVSDSSNNRIQRFYLH